MARKKHYQGRNDPPKGSGPNTPSFYYIDSAVAKADCAQDKDKIDKECKPESEAKKRERLSKKPDFLSRLALPTHSGKSKKSNAQWINDHCEFLMIKPSSPEKMLAEVTQARDTIVQEMTTKLKSSGAELLKDQLEQKLKHEIEKAVAEKLAKMAAKNAAVRGGSFLFGPEVGIPVNIIMSLDSADDALKLAQEARAGFPELTKELDKAKQALEKANKEINEVKNAFDKYKNEKGEFVPSALASDMMYGAAELNDCIRARRCSLVPYNQTENPASANGKGCCPGQSGHHVLPSSMFKGCTAYKEGAAPTICVEGTNNTHGSHGHIHKKLGERLGKVMNIHGHKIQPGAEISKEEAIEAGADSVQEAFPESKCNAACIKAQLRKFYTSLNCVAHNESGNPGGAEDKNTGRNTR